MEAAVLTQIVLCHVTFRSDCATSEMVGGGKARDVQLVGGHHERMSVVCAGGVQLHGEGCLIDNQLAVLLRNRQVVVFVFQDVAEEVVNGARVGEGARRIRCDGDAVTGGEGEYQTGGIHVSDGVPAEGDHIVVTGERSAVIEFGGGVGDDDHRLFYAFHRDVDSFLLDAAVRSLVAACREGNGILSHLGQSAGENIRG